MLIVFPLNHIWHCLEIVRCRNKLLPLCQKVALVLLGWHFLLRKCSNRNLKNKALWGRYYFRRKTMSLGLTVWSDSFLSHVFSFPVYRSMGIPGIFFSKYSTVFTDLPKIKCKYYSGGKNKFHFPYKTPWLLRPRPE